MNSGRPGSVGLVRTVCLCPRLISWKHRDRFESKSGADLGHFLLFSGRGLYALLGPFSARSRFGVLSADGFPSGQALERARASRPPLPPPPR